MAKRSIRAVIYARFSCDKQRDASIEDQLFECNRYAEKRGYKVIGSYCDYAMSGRSDERPQFLMMIDHAIAGQFDVILVWKLDRFARNMQDQYHYERIINQAGVQLESTREHITGGGIEASSNKALTALFAQIRSQQSAEDTMRGMLGKARRCQYLGIPTFGYSHDGDTITLDPVHAPMVKKIHADYLAGIPINQTIEWLIEQGVKTKNGKDPGYTFVTGILKNPRYDGTYIWGQKKNEFGEIEYDIDGKPIPLVKIEGGMPAIVTPETKEAVIKRLGFRQRRTIPERYELSGKLHCATCGKLMHGETCANKKGERYPHYVCQGKRKACNGWIEKNAMAKTIADAIRELLRDRELCESIAERFMMYQSSKDNRPSIEAAKKELREAEKRRKNIIQAVEDGMPYAEVKDRLASLEAEKEAIEARIDKIRHSSTYYSKDDVMGYFAAVSEGETDDDRLIYAFVSTVWLYPDMIAVLMNFNGADLSQYEVEYAIKNTNTLSLGETCSCQSSLVPPCSRTTNTNALITRSGHQIITLENGIGIILRRVA